MKNDGIKALKNLSLVSYIGIMMIVPIVAGVYLGNLADERLGTGHVLMIVCLIVGVIIGFLNVYKVIMKSVEKR